MECNRCTWNSCRIPSVLILHSDCGMGTGLYVEVRGGYSKGGGSQARCRSLVGVSFQSFGDGCLAYPVRSLHVSHLLARPSERYRSGQPNPRPRSSALAACARLLLPD